MEVRRTATQESVRFCTLPEQLSRYLVALCSSSRSFTSAYFMYAWKLAFNSALSGRVNFQGWLFHKNSHPCEFCKTCLYAILFEVVRCLHTIEGFRSFNVSALKVVSIDLHILLQLIC